MTLIELKKSIHEKVDSLNDRELLEAINAMLDNYGKVFQIPMHMKEGIRQGEQDIKNGDFITLEELEEKYENI